MSSFPEGNGTARHVLYEYDRAMLGARNASQGGWLRKTRSDRATGRKAQAHEPNLPMTNTLVLHDKRFLVNTIVHEEPFVIVVQ